MKKLFLSMMFLSVLSTSSTAMAQAWRHYTSDTGLFQTYLTEDAQENFEEMRINNGTVALSGVTFKTFDQRPYKNTIKNYYVKYQQSLGPKLSTEQMNEYVEQEMMEYLLNFKDMNGIVIEKKIGPHKILSVPSGDLHITYTDPDLGEQSLKMRLIMSPNTKYQQVVNGSEEAVNQFEAQQFFKVFYPSASFLYKNGTIKNEWKEYKSPLGIFTAYLPEKMDTYVPADVIIENTDNVERASIQFYDPLWRQYLFYNIHGYKLDKPANYENVEALLRKGHILNHRLTADQAKFRNLKNGDIAIMEAEYAIEPEDELPYADYVKLRALFLDDVILVHEIIGGRQHVKSEFINNVIRSVVFMPAEVKKSIKQIAEENERLKQMNATRRP